MCANSESAGEYKKLSCCESCSEEEKKKASEKAAKTKDWQDKISALKPGDIDPWLGQRVEVIISKETNVLIFLDAELAVQWVYAGSPPNLADVVSLQPLVTQLEFESEWLKKHDRTTLKGIRCQLAEAIAAVMDGVSSEEGKRILLTTRNALALLGMRKTRKPFFYSFVLIVILVKLCALVLPGFLGHPGWEDELNAGAAGAFGALVSAIIGMNRIALDPRADSDVFFVEALLRAILGIAAGVMVYFALEVGLIGSRIQANDSQAFGVMLAIAAGASERMLPAMVKMGERVFEKNK